MSSNVFASNVFYAGNVFVSRNVGIGTFNPATALDVFTGTMNAATVVATTLTGAGSGITSLNMGNAGSGTLAVARGGTGTTTSTGSGSVVLSSGPTLAGTTTIATLNLTNALVTGSGGTGLTSFTSGGLLYASSTSALASSGAYNAGQILYGGGAGAAPSSSSGLFYDSVNSRLGIGLTNPGYALQVNGSIGMVGGTSIPLTLPARGSQTSYNITLAASGTWYTVISDARIINATITGAIGQSDLTSTVFIATLIATGGASALMTLVTGNAANIRVSGTALQFLANGSSYGLNCSFTLISH